MIIRLLHTFVDDDADDAWYEIWLQVITLPDEIAMEYVN